MTWFSPFPRWLAAGLSPRELTAAAALDLTVAANGELQMFANKNQSDRRGRQPNEQHQLTKNLVASLWHATDERGTRYHWDLARAGEHRGQTYKTKRPADLLEVPFFTAKLCETFANSSAIDAELRKQLASLGAGLFQLLEVISTEQSDELNGDANKPSGDSRLFSS